MQLVGGATRDRDRRCRGFRTRQLSSGELTNLHSPVREVVQVTSSMEMENGVNTTSWTISLCVLSQVHHPPTLATLLNSRDIYQEMPRRP